MQSVMILGRQPALGVAELESLYGAEAIRPVGSKAAVLDIDPCLVAFDRLGSSVKFAKLLTTLDTIDLRKIEKFLLKASPAHSKSMPEGKMYLGISAIGLGASPAQLTALGLSLKKAVRKTGRPVRLVPNKDTELSSAQVFHNKLTTPNGWELVFIKDGQQTIIAQTVKVQDIDAYTVRDRGRPKRDARVGMLPPKLAQTLINLAVGLLPEEKLQNICDIPAGQPIPPAMLNRTILDPFCGTGVVLQEAMLMGYNVLGTDIDKRMVDYSYENLEWLRARFGVRETTALLDTGDATNHIFAEHVDFVASETYLGRPFTTKPGAEVLGQTTSECNLIIKKFLQNIHAQLKPGTRLCIAVPAWQVRPNDFKHLPFLDHLEEMGYNRVSFAHVRDEELLYFRPDQIVARELIVITRI